MQMLMKKYQEITKSGTIMPISDSITSKFDILEQKMNINEKKDRRRNWINPRRYRSSGNVRKA